MKEFKDGETGVLRGRLPPWMRRRVRESEQVIALKKILREKNLHTVCQSAGCPNITECFQKPTVTFLILGNVCTRNCRFCSVNKGIPLPVDPNEPRRIGKIAELLRLHHVVITSVTRDDLPDGGAEQFVKTVEQIHRFLPHASVEILIPDFAGNQKSLELVLESKLDILNHNVETVPRLYVDIRPEADFEKSLTLLRKAKDFSPYVITKSGLMIGLGETRQEVLEVFQSLLESGCDALTIGQYLSPSRLSYPVQEYISIEVFQEYRKAGLAMGFQWVSSGPFVRSSFNAEELMREKVYI